IDGTHPKSEGHNILAQVIHDAITGPDDNTAPSAPTGLSPTAPSTTSVNLTWDEPSGNPSGYEIYRDGACVKVVTSDPRPFSDSKLNPGIYSYSIRAFDRALNTSPKSASVTIDTRGTIPDPEPPTIPTGLSGSTERNAVSLTWNPSTDNVSVVGYQIRRETTLIGTTGETAWIDAGLQLGQTYSYSVRAYDPSGNYSEYCAPVQVEVPILDLPDGWQAADVGYVGIHGSSSFSSGAYSIQYSGSDIFNAADSFGYTYTPLSGDGSITARVVSMENTNEWAKCGVMIRETLEPGSTHASMVLTPMKKVSFQRRTGTNAASPSGVSTTFGSYPYWVRMVRDGETLTGFHSSDGTSWTKLSSVNLTMNANVWIGLAHCSHDNTRLNTAIIDNVSISGGGANQAPTLQGIGNQTVRAGETIRITIQASDPDSGPEPLQYSASAE
ncbi:MAG: hypothetical protein JW706_07945, partial [Opitutales bacterium]|nr:hypothetical protein [Opitutales bacterium]